MLACSGLMHACLAACSGLIPRDSAVAIPNFHICLAAATAIVPVTWQVS
ncbi:hypothetical protein LT85_1341 [Collimonas arenae]|uniref:Uncharacterized protein n=1 Tax=Collimonas arenae TaxID=279058 RepID=A0A0A1F9Z8_9BURK|nr:hypothetical protein LT85_1341 [Collimonas arenae]